MSAMCLVNCNVCDVDFAVRVRLTIHIKKDRNYNCNICNKKIWIIIKNDQRAAFVTSNDSIRGYFTKCNILVTFDDKLQIGA